MEKEENILGTEKIGKLMIKFAIPCIISMLVNSIYNIVDQIFIGQGVGHAKQINEMGVCLEEYIDFLENN